MLLIFLISFLLFAGCVLTRFIEDRWNKHRSHGDDILRVIQVYVLDVFNRFSIWPTKYNAVRTIFIVADAFIRVVVNHCGIHTTVVFCIVDFIDKIIRVSTQHINDFLSKCILAICSGYISCRIRIGCTISTICINAFVNG